MTTRRADRSPFRAHAPTVTGEAQPPVPSPADAWIGTPQAHPTLRAGDRDGPPIHAVARTSTRSGWIHRSPPPARFTAGTHHRHVACFPDSEGAGRRLPDAEAVGLDRP